MDLIEAESLAISLMQEHLDSPDTWTLAWDRAVTAHGSTHYGLREIRLGRRVTEAEDEENVRDTILHEIAHANVWDSYGSKGHGHGDLWKREAKRLGAVPTPEGTGTSANIREQAPWVGRCEAGHVMSYRYWRKPRTLRSCHICKPGRFSPEHLITYTKEAS